MGMFSMEGEIEARTLFESPSNEDNPVISHDSRWIAYETDESGEFQIYVQPFPDLEAGRWRISEDGGRHPLWNPQGGELFYRNGDEMMMVTYRTEPSFSFSSSEILFERPYHQIAASRRHDIAPDGQRFLMLKPMEEGVETAARTEIIVVDNFFDELKRLAPAAVEE